LPKRPKASFLHQFNENRRITFVSFEDQNELSGENIIAQVQKKKGEKWGTIVTMKMNRAPDGTYKQLPENK
jgi:hypothetical protein